MLDLSKDEHCLFVEQRLVDYALSVGRREQARCKFFANGGLEGKLKEDETYNKEADASEKNKKVFYESLNAYMAKFEKLEDKQQINGHFWWKVKEVYYKGEFRGKKLNMNSHHFFNDGLNYINDVFCEKPSTSLDKFRLLEHLVANGYLDKKDKNGVSLISRESLKVLASINPHDLKQNDLDSLYKVSVENISKKRRNEAGKTRVKTYFEMFQVYAKNIKLVHNSAVSDYAKMFFMMADKVDGELDIAVLRYLATKTMPAQKTARYCGEKKVLDKKAVCDIYKAYVEHVKTGDCFNENLANQMKRLAVLSFEAADYTNKDVDEILNTINVQIKGKAKLSGLNELRENIESLAKNNKAIQKNPLGENDGNYSYDNAINYAENLFKQAEKTTSNPVRICGLWNLVENEKENREQLVLDIAQLYVDYMGNKKMESLADMSLHEKMTKFFRSVVSEYDYDDDKVWNLQRVIEKGGNGNEAFEDMLFSIGNANAYKGDYRAEMCEKAHQIKPIHISKSDFQH